MVCLVTVDKVDGAPFSGFKVDVGAKNRFKVKERKN